MAVVTRDAVLQYLEEYLQVSAFPDYGPQGLQVEGSPEVRKLVTGVSACVELIERAVAAGAQMLLVHHGIFWDRDPRILRGPLKRRIELLLKHDLTLGAYHLCLDAHPELGNNILAARGLGLADPAPWAPVNGRLIGWRGCWDGLPPEEALARICRLYGSDPLAFLDGPPRIREVGIISGGAQSEVRRAAEEGLDLFITGEASEYVMHAAREYGMHYVAAGHHATERLGIRALGEHLRNTLGVEHEFIDVPNPV